MYALMSVVSFSRRCAFLYTSAPASLPRLDLPYHHPTTTLATPTNTTPDTTNTTTTTHHHHHHDCLMCHLPMITFAPPSDNRTALAAVLSSVSPPPTQIVYMLAGTSKQDPRAPIGFLPLRVPDGIEANRNVSGRRFITSHAAATGAAKKCTGLSANSPPGQSPPVDR